MRSTPTLQSLAVEAHDAFGEDGTPHTPSCPASFDVVVEVYVRVGSRARGEDVDSCACTAVTDALSGECPTEFRPAVRPFVSRALQFLRAQYPNPDEVKRDQRLLSTLFWAHLVEARYAPPSST